MCARNKGHSRLSTNGVQHIQRRVKRMSRSIRGVVLSGLVVGAALLLVGGTPLAACSCGGSAVSCESVWTTGAVFVGTVTELGAPVRGTREEPFPQRRVAFEVVEPFKGLEATAGTVELFTGNGGGDCGYPFIVGSIYLVFADESNGRLTASICSNTMPIEKAATDLAWTTPSGCARSVRTTW